MSFIPCSCCHGEGRKLTSRWGGNDPDVIDNGQCAACEGSGNETCEARGCSETAQGFDEDGRALCEECLFEWMCSLSPQERP